MFIIDDADAILKLHVKLNQRISNSIARTQQSDFHRNSFQIDILAEK
jgi:hypothetical protein